MEELLKNLRSRSLYQRHLILWLGSLLLFLLIFWLWLGQVRWQLASLAPRSFAQEARSKNFGVREKEQGVNGGIIEVIRKNTASFFSLFSRREEEQEDQRLKEGNELEQFLEYKPFP